MFVDVNTTRGRMLITPPRYEKYDVFITKLQHDHLMCGTFYHLLLH